MVKQIDNQLIYFIITHHINHFLNVKKLVKHDYESHMILLSVYTHFLFQTISKGKSLNWAETFAITETVEHKQLMKERKLTIFAISEDLFMSQETVRRKLKILCKRKLLEYSIKEGLGLGKKFRETIEPLGKLDGENLKKLIEKFKI